MIPFNEFLRSTISLSVLLLSVFFFVGCSHTNYKTNHNDNQAKKPEKAIPTEVALPEKMANPYFAAIAKQSSKPNKDKAAILAMQGEYDVDFNFNETVILASGYERFAPKEASAREVVLVIEDTDNKIVLQHILVVGEDHVIKHWRQDWTYQATERFEFIKDQYWANNPIKKENQKGMWTQCVFEVSDAPRYCGTGKWNHRYGVSTWTSDRTFRPLPRREYTIRSDYNALNVENRHTVTPSGWTHEQDNTKIKRSGENIDQTLVREFGFNDYKNIKGADFTKAYEYWDKTHAYWAQIRSLWTDYFNNHNHVAINTSVDGMPIINATFARSEQVKQSGNIPAKDELKVMLDQWVNVKKTSSN